ncbi:MAG: type II toxin-antitoxin system VapC family toxin [Chromatiaceae bacterium]
MSPILLDTHALVWLVSGNARLGIQARSVIQHAAAKNLLLVSAITPWEIAMLVRKGRLTLDRDVGDWVETSLKLPGIWLEPLSAQVAIASTRLPGAIHKDPADRIIAATARHLGAILLTEDNLLLDYSAAGHLRTLRASK